MSSSVIQTSSAYYQVGETNFDIFAVYEQLDLPAIPSGEEFVDAFLEQWLYSTTQTSLNMSLKVFLDGSWTPTSAASYFAWADPPTAGTIWEDLASLPDSGAEYTLTGASAQWDKWTAELTTAIQEAYTASGGAATEITIAQSWWVGFLIAPVKYGSGTSDLSIVEYLDKTPAKSIQWTGFGAGAPYKKTLTLNFAEESGKIFAPMASVGMVAA